MQHLPPALALSASLVNREAGCLHRTELTEASLGLFSRLGGRTASRDEIADVHLEMELQLGVYLGAEIGFPEGAHG